MEQQTPVNTYQWLKTLLLEEFDEETTQKMVAIARRYKPEEVERLCDAFSRFGVSSILFGKEEETSITPT